MFTLEGTSVRKNGCPSCKLYFELLTKSPRRENFLLHEPIQKSNVCPMVKSLVWTVVPNTINTKDMLQKYKLLTILSPNMYVVLFQF